MGALTLGAGVKTEVVCIGAVTCGRILALIRRDDKRTNSSMALASLSLASTIARSQPH